MEKLKFALVLLTISNVAFCNVIPNSMPLRGLAFQESSPYVYTKKDSPYVLEGFLVELTKLIAEKAEFSFSMGFLPEERKPNNKIKEPYDVMVDYLKNNKTDFVIGELVVTETEDFEFTVPIIEDIKIAAVVRSDIAKLKGACKVQDLVATWTQRKDITFGAVESTLKSSTFHIMSKNYNDEGYRMYRMMKVNKAAMMESYDDGIRKVENFAYALLTEDINAMYIAGHNCKFTILWDSGNKLPRRAYAIAMPKGSPYLAAFNKAIQELKEDKIIENLMKTYWVNECNHELLAKCPATDTLDNTIST